MQPDSRLRIAGVVLLLVGSVALVVATGAGSYGGSDELSDSLRVQPHHGPNGDYVTVEGEELVLDASSTNPALGGDGLNPNACFEVGDAVLLSNRGSDPVRVWIEHDVDGAAFYADRRIESEENAVELAPNESVGVGVRIETGDAGDRVRQKFTIRSNELPAATDPGPDDENGRHSSGFRGSPDPNVTSGGSADRDATSGNGNDAETRGEGEPTDGANETRTTGNADEKPATDAGSEPRPETRVTGSSVDDTDATSKVPGESGTGRYLVVAGIPALLGLALLTRKLGLLSLLRE